MAINIKRNRMTIDVPSDVKRRLRIVAAHQDVSIRQYVLETIEQQLAKDWARLAEQEGLLALTAESDPVLNELWDNEMDAAYDTILCKVGKKLVSFSLQYLPVSSARSSKQ